MTHSRSHAQPHLPVVARSRMCEHELTILVHPGRFAKSAEPGCAIASAINPRTDS